MVKGVLSTGQPHTVYVYCKTSKITTFYLFGFYFLSSSFQTRIHGICAHFFVQFFVAFSSVIKKCFIKVWGICRGMEGEINDNGWGRRRGK